MAGLTDSFVFTVKERCRVCYTCVRECPAKAIKIINGQADILSNRCIACGNCVQVCSRKAKQFTFSINEVNELLEGPGRVAALIAPSVAAEFSDITDYRNFVGMIKALGFDYVNEVAFGAELVANEYKKLLQDTADISYISTSCPALVNYVEKFHPRITANLAPIVSPMIATAKVLRKMHGPDLKMVFIGPCIAKKGEAIDPQFEGLIDVVISFIELREMFAIRNITEDSVEAFEFDPPIAGKGSVFPISGGMLQTVDLEEDFVSGEIVVADGRQNVTEVLREFEEGHLEAKLFDLLCCNGCIKGAGMSNRSEFFNKRKSISNFAKRKFDSINYEQWQKHIEEFSTLDLHRTYKPNNQRFPNPRREDVVQVLQKLGKFAPEDELNCGACGYDTCLEHAMAIIKGIAEIEMCLPYTIDELHKSISELDTTNKKLASTQQALKQSEKLASMGQLAAGIAHEVNNPLGIIIMYSYLLLDDIDEANPMHKDLKLIVEQADRCKKIVGGLLNFARKSKVNISDVNIGNLIKDGIQSIFLPENVCFTQSVRTKSPLIQVDHDQMVQVFSNLFKNAIDAMPSGGNLTIEVEDAPANEVMFSIKDTGTGISKENMERMFEPFFTTKETGKGTGLGLPIIYGIVKMHRGQIKVESNYDLSKGPTGTTFFVSLPKQSKVEE
ncbi:MAG: 4Fe-4S dicluster domain-containing protein [Bacteroidales bacterium]|nr:4Fe-4S dicluster domain-containing protein [Bacteroidales bacterium]